MCRGSEAAGERSRPAPAERSVFADSGRVAHVDLGPDTDDPVDYPDMAGKLAVALGEDWAQQGLLLCGTGIGITIAANCFPWIRAAVCHDVTSARLAREHNDANVLALGARLIGPEVAGDCLLIFLKSRFAGGRHARRVAKMSAAMPQPAMNPMRRLNRVSGRRRFKAGRAPHHI